MGAIYRMSLESHVDIAYKTGSSSLVQHGSLIVHTCCIRAAYGMYIYCCLQLISLFYRKLKEAFNTVNSEAGLTRQDVSFSLLLITGLFVLQLCILCYN